MRYSRRIDACFESNGRRKVVLAEYQSAPSLLLLVRQAVEGEARA